MADTSLLVDIGNSRLKWQLAGAGDDGKPESLAHGGRLPISLEQQWTAIAQPRRVLVSCVADTGIGIAEEDQAQIFQKFFRAGGDDMKTRSGHGLVLPLARDIVELHHGTIRVESEPGQGSCFTVFLPEASA